MIPMSDIFKHKQTGNININGNNILFNITDIIQYFKNNINNIKNSPHNRYVPMFFRINYKQESITDIVCILKSDGDITVFYPKCKPIHLKSNESIELYNYLFKLKTKK